MGHDAPAVTTMNMNVVVGPRSVDGRGEKQTFVNLHTWSMLCSRWGGGVRWGDGTHRIRIIASLNLHTWSMPRNRWV